MKAEIKSASNEFTKKTIEVNSIDDLELLYMEYDSKSLIIDFTANKMTVLIYDGYIE